MAGFRIEGNTSGNVVEVTTAHALQVDGSATTQPVSISGTLPVSGSVAVNNFPATQPVSGTVALAAGSAAVGSVSVSNFPSTQPISGTVAVNNFPSTQAVSAASLPLPAGAATSALQSSIITALGSPAQAGGAVSVSNFPATQPVSGTVAVNNFPGTQAVSGTVTAAQTTAANLQASVTQQPLTKGAQGANGVSTQDLKDSGRNLVTYFTAVQVQGGTPEALLSLTGFKSGAAVAATTTPAVVSAGKTFRLQAMTVTVVAAVASLVGVQVQIRANPAGLVTITSPLVDSFQFGLPSATGAIGECFTVQLDFPDGFEFAAGTGLGITVAGLSTAGAVAAAGQAVKLSVKGFEY